MEFPVGQDFVVIVVVVTVIVPAVVVVVLMMLLLLDLSHCPEQSFEGMYFQTTFYHGIFLLDGIA